jgi:hypothetical protein
MTTLTICPCCGARLSGAQTLVACSACGARAVGPPLVRPDRELPGYGLALAVSAWGTLLVIIFFISTIAALIERQPFSLAFWNIVASAETAAWRLKAFALPLALVALWPSLRALKILHRAPARFAGLRLARTGFAMTAFVALAIAVLIGVTVPARLRQRALAAEAKENAIADETTSVLLRYQIRFGTYPASAQDLRDKLPDPDGSVARVAELIKSGTYEPVSDIAALPASATKARARRGADVRLRNTALHTDDAPDEGLSFTSYTLVLPGPDRKLGTPDDIMLRDGRIVPPLPANTSRTNQNNTP